MYVYIHAHISDIPVGFTIKFSVFNIKVYI